MWPPRGCHVAATGLPCGRHGAAMWPPWGCHGAATWLPRGCHVAAMGLPWGCHGDGMGLPWSDPNGHPKAVQWCPKGSSHRPMTDRRQNGDHLGTIWRSSGEHLGSIREAFGDIREAFGGFWEASGRPRGLLGGPGTSLGDPGSRAPAQVRVYSWSGGATASIKQHPCCKIQGFQGNKAVSYQAIRL